MPSPWSNGAFVPVKTVQRAPCGQTVQHQWWLRKGDGGISVRLAMGLIPQEFLQSPKGGWSVLSGTVVERATRGGRGEIAAAPSVPRRFAGYLAPPSAISTQAVDVARRKVARCSRVPNLQVPRQIVRPGGAGRG